MSTLQKHKILIVDDNRINQRITSALLQSLGTEYSQAKNGFEAIDLAMDGDITAIFINLFLPGMNGFETTKKIRLKSNIPIIAITSEQVNKMTDKMKAAGFTNVLFTPFDKEVVIKVLQSLTKGDTVPVFDQTLYKTTFKDVELQRDIIDTFLNEKTSDTTRITSAFKSKDTDEIYSAIHYMKGSFSYLKASKILVVTQNILDRLKQGDLDYALEHKDEFISQYNDLIEVLKKV